MSSIYFNLGVQLDISQASSLPVSRQNSRSSVTSRSRIQLPDHFDIDFQKALDTIEQGPDNNSIMNPMYDPSMMATMAPFASLQTLEASGLPEGSFETQASKSVPNTPVTSGTDPLKRSDSVY